MYLPYQFVDILQTVLFGVRQERQVMRDASLRVYFIRHGRVDSHQGDMPLSSEGIQEIVQAVQQLSRDFVAGEEIVLLHAPPRRARETAVELYRLLTQKLARLPGIQLVDPLEHAVLRNPDIYVAGTRVELVSSAEALAEQLPESGLEPAHLQQMPFWKNFWQHPDRIGYWVGMSKPPGEHADAVARRLLMFAISLLDLPQIHPRSYLCVTHSPVMRAFLRRYVFGYDPGEPDYVESVKVDFSDKDSYAVYYRDIFKERLL